MTRNADAAEIVRGRRADRDVRARERRALTLMARCAAVVCGACGRTLAADEPVWMGRLYIEDSYGCAPTCGACARDRRWLPPEDCGGCGRMVTYPAARRTRLGAFCSSRCQSRWYNRRRRGGRESRIVSTRCISCGGTFEARRTEARTCSPACRQRTYRTRMREALRTSGRSSLEPAPKPSPVPTACTEAEQHALTIRRSDSLDEKE